MKVIGLPMFLKNKNLFSKVAPARIIDWLIILFISFIPMLWIPEGKILTGHDSGYPINVLETYKNRFFTWNSQDSLGLDNTTSISVIPVLTIQAAARSVGFDVADSERITFIFWFFAIQAAMYIFAWSLRDAISYRWFPLTASILYVFNFYLLALWRYGAGTTFSAYTALPLVMTSILLLLRGKVQTVQSAIFFSLTLFIFNGGGGLSVPLFGGVLVALFWAIAYYLVIERHDVRSLLRKLTKFVLISIGVSMMLNAYWLFPFLHFVITTYATTLQAVGGKAAVVKWTDSVSLSTTISNLFRLQGYPDWYNNPYHPYANAFLRRAPLIVVSLLFAPTAYLGLLVAKQSEHRKLVVFFATLSLIGIFFSAGTHPPTGWIYSLFMLYVPGFVVFRSAQYKFIPALLFAMAILISYSVNYIISETKISEAISKKHLKSIQTALVFLFLGTIIAYHYPFFQRNFFAYTDKLTTIMSVPEYVHSFDRWSQTNLDNEGRTLILPRFNSTWKAGLFTWGYFSLYSPFNLITPKPFIQYSYYLNEAQFNLFNRLTSELRKSTPLASRLISFFQIRHILLAKDIKVSDVDMPTESWKLYEPAMRAYPSVWSEGEWHVYEVPSYEKQKIFGIPDVMVYNGEAKYAIGPILGGARDFVLPEVLGKNTRNPMPDPVFVSGSVRAYPCSSCRIDRSATEVIPSYTNIVPGSRLYGIKRWKENRDTQNRPIEQLPISHILGLTLKRVSELVTLADLAADSVRFEKVVHELSDLWMLLSSRIPSGLGSDDLDSINRLYDFSISENAILRKIKTTHTEYGTQLEKVIMQTGQMAGAIDELKLTHQDTATYLVNTNHQEGLIYLDPESLAKDRNGALYLPNRVTINNITHALPRITSAERIDVGVFTITSPGIITISFAKQSSLLKQESDMEAFIDNANRTCKAMEVAGFEWEKQYKLTLSNSGDLPKNTQVYIRKKKNYMHNFSILDARFKPDYAYNFDRERIGSQSHYFSGSDGDQSAFLYVCTTGVEPLPAMNDHVSVTQVISPALFVREENRKPSPIQKISYKRINQTKYSIDLTMATFPMILVFNENYNISWRLSESDQTDSLKSIMTRWFVPSYAGKSHMQINGSSNAWYLKDRPKNGTLILEYFPQALLYKGVMISIAGLVGLVIIYFLNRKRV